MNRKSKRDAYLSRPKTPARPAAEPAAARSSEIESGQSGTRATRRDISSPVSSARNDDGNSSEGADLAGGDRPRGGMRSVGKGRQGLDLLQLYAAAVAFSALMMLMFDGRGITNYAVVMLSPPLPQCLDESAGRAQGDMGAEDKVALSSGGGQDDGAAAFGSESSVADFPDPGEEDVQLGAPRTQDWLCDDAALERAHAPANLVGSAINFAVALPVFAGHLMLLLWCRGVRFRA